MRDENERNRVVGEEGVYRLGDGRSSILQCCLNSIDRPSTKVSQITPLGQITTYESPSELIS